MMRYQLREPDGAVVAVHVRSDGPNGKRMSWELPNGDIGLAGLRTADLPMYLAHLATTWDRSRVVVIAEGEKATDKLIEAGYQACGTVTGAASTPSAASLEVLRGHRVVLWPDADDAGRQHMARIAERLGPIAATVSLVAWPDAPPGGDAADVGEADAIGALIDGAEPVLSPEARLRAVIDEQAPEFRERLNRAYQLVDAQRAQPLTISEPEDRPIADILESVKAFVGRFVTFTNSHQANAIALWLAHVYAIDAAPSAAYLRITSAAEEAGKTTLLECLEALLGRRALNAVSVTPAALFRTRDKVGPVALLLDEIDNTLRDRKDDGARDLLAIVNAGYRRSAAVLRTVGQNHEAKRFAAFGPAAIAGLGNLHPSTESRCIPIVLERKLTTQGERWLPFLFEDEIEALRQQLEAWAGRELIDRLRPMTPDLPTGLRDRHAEVWWSMLSIADLAGGDWPSQARDAATVLHTERDANATSSLGVLLLRHIHRAFEEASVDRLPTVDLLNRLVSNEEGPWGRWWGAELKKEGPPSAAAADLAAKLRPFGPKPHVIRVGDTTPRGYLLDDFAKPFAQYQVVPPIPPATPATPATPEAERSDLISEDADQPVAPVAPVAGGYGRYSDKVDELQAALGWPPRQEDSGLGAAEHGAEQRGER